MQLSGSTALVTGASRGIGAAVARRLASSGARVGIVARDSAALERQARDLGGGAAPFPADLSDGASVRALVHAFEREMQGPPDILVNNAGVFGLAPLAEMEAAMFLESVHVNLVTPFLLVNAFAREMQRRGSGHVVGIGSIADRVVMPGNGAYSPAKYGLRALHEVLRQELRGSGVRVTLISPGAVNTGIWDELLDGDRARSLPSRDMMLDAGAVAEAVMYAVQQPAAVNIDELRLSHA